MNKQKDKNNSFFYEYYQRGNDSKRLSILLLTFAFILCPLFAFVFKTIGAPSIYFYDTFSSTFVFPLILFLERVLPIFRGKIPFLYFIFFNCCAAISFFDLYKNHFESFHFAYYIGLYAVLNFATQRFHYSLIFFINNLIFFIVGVLLTKNFQEIEHAIPLSVLLFCIGVFALVIYYSRDKMVHNIQDHNTYLRNIVNNIGSGVLFFKVQTNSIEILDMNQVAAELFDLESMSDVQEQMNHIFDLPEFIKLQQLELFSSFEKEHKVNSKKRSLSIRINKIVLKNGLFYLATIFDITERAAENLLIKENEKKYKNLFIRNLTPLITFNLDGTVIEFNQAFEKLITQEKQLSGKLFENNEWIQLKEKLVLNGTILNYNKMLFKDTDRPLYLVFNFYYDHENQLIEGNIQDVTDVTLRSKALLENENKYRLIYEESNDSVLLLDEDRIIDINQQGLRLFGKNLNEMLEKSLWDFTYNQQPDLQQKYLAFFNKLKQEKQVKFPWIFAFEDRFIETFISIVELNLGEEKMFQCVIRDETEQNRNIRELENSKRTFESIIENTPEGFIITKGTKTVFANKEFYRLFSLDDVPYEQLDLKTLIIGESYQTIQKMLQAHQQDKLIKQKVLLNEIANEVKEIDVTIVGIVFEDQEAQLFIFKDITIQAQFAKEVVRAEIAEESSKKLTKEIVERMKAEQRLEAEISRTKAIFNSSENTLLFTIDPHFKITSFNNPSKEYFEAQTGYEFKENIDFESYFGYIVSPLKLRYFRYLLSAMRKGKSQHLELKFINKYNEKKWLEIYVNPIIDKDQNLTEISLVSHDVTEKKKNEKELLSSLKEKEVLLKEVHHRVKNNLQIISSILNLQSSYIEDPAILEIIEESRHRIRSMAIIHENLYQNTNFSSINFKNYARELVRNLISSYSYNRNLDIDLEEKVENVELSLDQSIPCGLIINELITNTMKYAFPERKKGTVYLQLSEKNTIITLVVGDDGVGLPKGFNISETESLGLQLVITLVEQLGGNIDIDTKKGIKYFITFEKQKL